MTWPITSAMVTAEMGIAPAGDADATHIELCTDAVVDWVEAHVLPSPVVPEDVSAAVQLGAVMLAHRLYSRRGSISGVAGFAELGSAYIMRSDPDIARMLGLGKPRVG